MTVDATAARGVETLGEVVIRFAGDSGDGMQLVGDRFTELSAVFGNDLATQPDFPAEIRAPAGSLGGVSGFQISFGDEEVLTPGDAPYVLIAMNPAALKVNLADLQPGGVVIVDEDTERCGFAAELGFQIMERGFDLLDTPVKRVCAANYPIPGGYMEQHVLPSAKKVKAAIEAVMA